MKVLIVESDATFRADIVHTLMQECTVLEAHTRQEGERVFAHELPELVCLDTESCHDIHDTFDIMNNMLTTERHTKIIVITTHGDDSMGTKAIGHGAFDYLQKPVKNEELLLICRRAQRIYRLEKMGQIPATKKHKTSHRRFGMIGACPAMQNVFTLIDKVAHANIGVLITGESGTGKELCARSIHNNSRRRERALVPINCGAIPETLLESELFGYVRGAFTGAHTNKKGLIEAAHEGTLFLDEIGDMPLSLQVKLLRFLEDKTYQRLGDVTTRHADVRIIAATNKETVYGEGQQSNLRSDLYYRLSEMEINLPPLRSRGRDIDLIADEIIAHNRDKFDLPKLALSERARKLMHHYRWSGNIRELENKLNRASFTCRNQVIEPEDLHLSSDSFSRVTYKEARDFFEKEYIANVLREAKFCIAEAARTAGLSRPTLYDMMKKHGIKIRNKAQVEYAR